MELTVKTSRLDEKHVLVALEGRLDALKAQEVKNEFKKNIEQGLLHIIVDLGKVGFIDSSGLSSLIAGLKYAREAGGWLRIASVKGQVRSVLTLTKLDRIFEFYPDADAALKG